MPHPFETAVFLSWSRERGFDPEWLRAMMEGRQQASRTFAETALRELGVPLDAWPLLEPDWGQGRPVSGRLEGRKARSLREKRSVSTSADTHPGAHEDRIAAIVRSKHRTNGHPFLIWLDDKPLEKWAEENGLTRAKVQSWINRGKGHRSPSPELRRKIAEASKDANGVPRVPESVWDSPAWVK
jgi:hypothetical protein